MVNAIADRRKDRDEGGFTLIELLVVIIILGILAAVVVFAVGGIGDKGQADACRIDTRTIRTAEEAFFANDKTPPNDYGDMTALVQGGFLSQPSTLHTVTVTPEDPATPGQEAAYTIKVAGAAGTAQKCGTGDATVNGTTNL